MISVSVIIPMYNAEQYIKHAAESLFSQTLADIEYIFVDDGSKDDTETQLRSIVEKYPNRKEQIKIIPSSPDGKNSGVAKARQTGLDASSGDFVTFCDADDWVDNDYYEALYNAAIKNDAYIAVGDYILEAPGKSEIIIAPDIKNWQAFLSYHGWFHLSLANRLIKRTLIVDNDIKFYNDINFSEDYGFVMKAYYYSNRNCKIDSNSVYHYNKMNEDSLTTRVTKSAQLQRIKCIKLLDDFFQNEGCSLDKCEVHAAEKLAAKDGLLAINEFRLWKRTFPEVATKILDDAKRNVIYKTAYLAGQFLSWRILWLYHYCA